jgi:hypothetical protein
VLVVRRPSPVPAELSTGPFHASDAAGLVGRGALAGPSYRRLLRGVYQAADRPVDHGTMIDAVRRGGMAGVLCGPSAAWAHGCRLAGPGDPVHLVTAPHGAGRDADGVVRHRTELPAADVVDTPWGPATTPSRTAVDLARGVGTGALAYPRAVAWVDALLRATDLRAVQARRALASSVGLGGLPRGRTVMRAARDGVDSPRETELRLLVVRFRFPEPRVQCPVLDGGRVVARLDLGWSRCRTGLEYDGQIHLDPDQHSVDLRRLNEVRSLDWQVLQVDNRAFSRPGPWLRQLAGLVPRR